MQNIYNSTTNTRFLTFSATAPALKTTPPYLNASEQSKMDLGCHFHFTTFFQPSSLKFSVLRLVQKHIYIFNNTNALWIGTMSEATNQNPEA